MTFSSPPVAMGGLFSFDSGMRFSFALPLLLLAASPAAAHPLTDIRFDRTAAVRLSADGVEVTYTLQVGLLAMHLDAAKRLTAEEIASLDKTARGYAAAYAKKVAPELAERIHINVDGKPMPLTVTAIDVTFADHAECRFTLRALWPPGGRERTLSVEDDTFTNHPGALTLTLDVRGGIGKRVELNDVDDPPERLRGKQLELLSASDAALARRASAAVLLPEAIAMPDTGMGIVIRAQPLPEPAVNVGAPTPNLFTDLYNRGLPALFDSTLGIGMLLLAAFLFGAAHAFTPGHGKTLVAAYLVGERGTVKHAVILGCATTIAHTGSVIAIAAILYGVYGNNVPGKTQGTLQFVAGLMVVGVGLWLLLRRAAGKSDHFHLFEGHSHSHDHDHGLTHSHSHSHGPGQPHHHHGPAPEKAKTTTGWTRLVLMGVGGGLVPCWDAVLLLVAAVAMDRVGFAIPMLFAFSAGLGTVLVALGVAVVYAHRAGATRFKDHRWFRLLPVISAVFLVAIGFWLCKQAIGMAMR
jgi:nickel/cobalt transporter (NicO) family protein